MSIQDNQSFEQNRHLVMEVLNKVATNPKDFDSLWCSISANLTPETFIETSLAIFKQEDTQLPANLKILLSVFLKQLLKLTNNYDDADVLKLYDNIYELILSADDLKTKTLYAEAFLRLYSRLTSSQREELIRNLFEGSFTLSCEGSLNNKALNTLLSNMTLLSVIFKEIKIKNDTQLVNTLLNIFTERFKENFPLSQFLLISFTLNAMDQKCIDFYFNDFLENLFYSCSLHSSFETVLSQRLDMWISIFNTANQCGEFELAIYLKLFETIDWLNTVFSKSGDYIFVHSFTERYSESLNTVVLTMLQKSQEIEIQDKDNFKNIILRMLTLIIATNNGRALLKPKLHLLVRELILPCLAETDIEKDNATDNPVEYVNYRFDCVDLRESRTAKTNAFMFLDALCENFAEFSLFVIKSQIYIASLCLHESPEIHQSLKNLNYEDISGEFFAVYNDRYAALDAALMIITSLVYLTNENPRIINMLDHLLASILSHIETKDQDTLAKPAIKKLMSSVFLLFTFSSDFIFESQPDLFNKLLDYGFSYLSSYNNQDILSIQIIMTIHKIIEEERVLQYITNNSMSTLSVMINKATQFNLPEIYEIIESLIANLEPESNEELLKQIMNSISYNLRVPDAHINKLLDLCGLLIVNISSMSLSLDQTASLFIQELLFSDFTNKAVTHTKEVFRLIDLYFKHGKNVQTVRIAYFRRLKEFMKVLNTAPIEQTRIFIHLLQNCNSLFLEDDKYMTQLAQNLIVNIYTLDPNEVSCSLLILTNIYMLKLLDIKNFNDHLTLLLTDLFPSLAVDITSVIRLDCVNIIGLLHPELFITIVNRLNLSLSEYIKRATFIYINNQSCSKYQVGHFISLLISIIRSGVLDQLTLEMYISLAILLLNFNFKRQYEHYTEDKNELVFRIQELLGLSKNMMPINNNFSTDYSPDYYLGDGKDDEDALSTDKELIKFSEESNACNYDLLKLYEQSFSTNGKLWLSEYKYFTNFAKEIPGYEQKIVAAFYRATDLVGKAHLNNIARIDYRTMDDHANGALRMILKYKRN